MSVAGLSLAELRAAYVVQTLPARTLTAETRVPSVSVGIGAVGVLGVSGGLGATTVALALAEALPARGLFEFASPHASGLAGAATDEQGERHGWRVGRRGELELARRLDPGAAAGVDVGDAVVDLGAWAGDAPEHDLDRLVVVAGCSIPSIRRLEACLQSVNASTVLIPVITRAGRRLSRELLGASGPALRAAFKAGAVHVVPQCRRLLFTGLTPDPLPRSLRQSAAGIALALKESS